jgi:hypothetical protein
MSTLVLLPDVEQLLWSFLRDQPEVTALVDPTRIVSHTPDTTSGPWVRIRRIGGVPLIDRPLVLEQARVQFDVYGGTKSQAYTLAETIRQVCSDRLVGQHAEGVVTGVTYLTLIYLPDSEVETQGGGPRPRYTFDMLPITKPPANPPA